jgi:hypothetical protein
MSILLWIGEMICKLQREGRGKRLLQLVIEQDTNESSSICRVPPVPRTWGPGDNQYFAISTIAFRRSCGCGRMASSSTGW